MRPRYERLVHGGAGRKVNRRGAPKRPAAGALSPLGYLIAAAAVAMAGPTNGGSGGFTHAPHLDQGIECTDCHASALTSARTSDDLLPTPEECEVCHEGEPWASARADSAGVYAGRRHRTVIAKEIIFSHKSHIEMGLSCEECHSGGKEVRAAVEPATMQGCFQCHEGRRGTDDCASCHLRVHILTPSDHDGDWTSNHREEARQDDERCLLCHNRDYCQDCHEGGDTLPTEVGYAQQFLPYGPQLAGDGLRVERAHELNYLYTHPLDAAAKESDCFSCHRYETFCLDCHAPEDDPDRFRPLWHGGPGWGAEAGAVGTGGGTHAEMARRDMELCAACHEVGAGAADPECLECHRDSTPGRGNDPSTHRAGFAGDVGEGEWHDEEGAVCYVCHTREAGADGFCGYCHEPREFED